MKKHWCWWFQWIGFFVGVIIGFIAYITTDHWTAILIPAVVYAIATAILEVPKPGSKRYAAFLASQKARLARKMVTLESLQARHEQKLAESTQQQGQKSRPNPEKFAAFLASQKADLEYNKEVLELAQARHEQKLAENAQQQKNAQKRQQPRF